MAIPVGVVVIRSMSVGLSAPSALAAGSLVALFLYAACATAVMRATGSAAFRLSLAFVLGFLQLIVVVSAGFSVIHLAYWLFGG